MANNTIIHGWQDQPNYRGTFDIIKICIGTIFLLCWSSVCPNVPSLKGGFWLTFRMKVSLFLLAILGPDFIFMTAMGQLHAAWRARKALRNEGYAEWNLRHCFFANMGGVHLEFRDRKLAGLSSFPADCDQLLYLVQQKHMDLPKISEDDIEDRNKTDGLARGITIVQVLWFTTNVFGRIAQGLCVTTLELTTLGFIFLMICCSICWWRKPMGVTRPVIIFVNADLSAVLRESGAASVPRGRTPLSYVNRREWFMSQFWFYYTQILCNMKLLPQSNAEVAETDCFPSVDFPEADLKWEICLCWAIPAYSAIFMAAWNFTFPTTIESLLWRISAGICLFYGFCGSVLAGTWQNRSIIEDYYRKVLRCLGVKKGEHLQATRDENSNTLNISSLATRFHQVRQWFDWMRNMSPDRDPMLALKARIWLPTTLLCIMYCFSRAYILIEDVIGLRSLPQSAFQTVNWGQYSPIL
jgi:hypothetical protein